MRSSSVRVRVPLGLAAAADLAPLALAAVVAVDAVEVDGAADVAAVLLAEADGAAAAAFVAEPLAFAGVAGVAVVLLLNL